VAFYEPPNQCRKIHSINVKINIPIDLGGTTRQNSGNFGKGLQMPSVPGFTIGYAKVEQTLVRVHNVAPGDISAFRSRFGSLQRGGLLGAESQPGKGRKLEYGPDQIHRAVLAFDLIQVGIAPSIILALVDEYWDSKLRDIFMKAESAIIRETSDVVLILAGGAALSSETAVPNINHTTLDKISERIKFALDGEDLPARVVLVNLSAQLRKFHRALVDHHLGPEPVIEATKKSKRRPARR
jgi:hypothetical protein